MKLERKFFLHSVLTRYAEIPDQELNKLGNRLHTQSLKKGNFFIRQGDERSRLALIHSGIFRVYCVDESGNEKTLAFRTTGQFLAAYSPFITKQKTWYSIQALTNSELLYFDFDDYTKLASSNACWNTLEKNYIVELFIEKEDRERSFLLEDATTRYIEFKKKYPEIEKTTSQYYIASYLGISPVSLSRIRAEMKKSKNNAPSS